MAEIILGVPGQNFLLLHSEARQEKRWKENPKTSTTCLSFPKNLLATRVGISCPSSPASSHSHVHWGGGA